MCATDQVLLANRELAGCGCEAVVEDHRRIGGFWRIILYSRS
jgi:hypothetical protein